MASIWRNMNNVMQAMKKLNAKEFGGIEDKIHKCRHQLELLQQDMEPQEKIQAENQAKETLQKWLNVEESIIRKKSKVLWLKSAHNRVSMLTNVDGVVITHSTKIEDEVTRSEVVEALKGINDMNEPGCGGLNVLFFKKAWPIVGEDIIDAVQETWEPREKIEAENQAIETLQKWLNVEESIIRQKSRVQWLKLGDSNTINVFANLKQRLGHNRVSMLTNTDGVV
ncbi:hypothetical protein H5410_030473, partial [Solanum commersonii]